MVVFRHSFRVKVLGPEDWDGYERNRISKKWELIEYLEGPKKGQRVWVVGVSLNHG